MFPSSDWLYSEWRLHDFRHGALCRDSELKTYAGDYRSQPRRYGRHHAGSDGQNACPPKISMAPCLAKIPFMKNRLRLLRTVTVAGQQVLAGLMAVNAADAGVPGREDRQVANAAYQLVVRPAEGPVWVRWQDKLLDLCLADGLYFYAAQKADGTNRETFRGLEEVKMTGSASTLVIRGKLAGLELEHRLVLSSHRPVLEERILLRNHTKSLIALSGFEAGFLRGVTDKGGEVLPELANDRWVAVPLRVRATDAKGFVNDFSIQQLVAHRVTSRAWTWSRNIRKFPRRIAARRAGPGATAAAPWESSLSTRRTCLQRRVHTQGERGDLAAVWRRVHDFGENLRP